MEYFWILFFVLFFATNSLDKAECVQLFDEIFGEGWWDKDKAEEWNKLTLEQNSLHQIDRENTQIGHIEPNSTEQNPPLTESDHSANVKNCEEQNEVSSKENIAEDEQRRKIVDNFQAMKDEFKQKGKHSKKEWNQIEEKIAKHLKTCRKKIFEWKKEFGLSRKLFYEKEERKHLVEKFDQMKAELKRDGFKNSYQNQIYKTVAKELGLSLATIYRWKNELGQTVQHIYSDSEQKELMKLYYEIKDQTPKSSDENIAKRLKIGKTTLYKWKKQFKRHAANVQEIGNSNSGSI